METSSSPGKVTICARGHGEGTSGRRRQMAGVTRLVGGDGTGAHAVEAHGRPGDGAHRGGVGRVGQWQVAGVTDGSASGPASSAVSSRPSTVMGVDTASMSVVNVRIAPRLTEP